ncbi:uncharacterized protein LOC121518422 isoform X2 [Cheilinus undulatus]|uniref:uncharacterized protein LOC121518422 isoform X2 n=1 Tax=Cheilinus undulatus TaxID=241271 RepID=UPI001BD65CAC|nr:uncharacterized protein LOC121518422 isoform X2 [Cheilinus undulatus]
MGRYKCRAKLSRESGLHHQRDTPVKPAPRGKNRKWLPIRHYDPIPEEPELGDIKVPSIRPANTIMGRIKLIRYKSVFGLSSPELTENTTPSAAPDILGSTNQVSPSPHPTTQMTPDLGALKYATPVRENLAVASESITSSSIESDSTFSSDDEEEDCCSSASSSSSLLSPEIFRRESCDLLGLHPYIKNSTLLDASHAESIQMYHPPNLSTIIDVSSILVEKKSEIKGTEAGIKQHRDPLKSDGSIRFKTPPKPTNRRPISYKKKVSFKSPIISATFEEKHILTNNLTSHNTAGPVGTATLAEKENHDADTSRASDSGFKEGAVCPMPSLASPTESVSMTAKFFDFANDSKRDEFFKRMRERTVRLWNVPLLPLTAAKPKTS